MKRPLILVLCMVLTLFLIAVVALGTIASSKVYFLREGSGGTLYSKGDEAYLFMNGSRRGYHFTYLEFPWMALKQVLNAPPFPDDRRVSDIVIRVTPSAVDRQIVDFGEETGGVPNSITPFDDGFYARCPGVILCKWTGKSFEPATEEEQRRHDGTNRLDQGHTNSETINGWSRRRVGFSPGDHFEAQVGNKFVIAAKNQSTAASQGSWVWVDLLRPGQPPERLYEVNETPRRVEKAEYERAFH